MLQAYVTTRKGGKRFAVYDLTMSFAWEGKWLQESAEGAPEEKKVGKVASRTLFT